jgi:hypothetical protein
LKSKTKGPAVLLDVDSKEDDIIDEAIYYFRANCLFNTFELKNDCDRTLVYLTFYIQYAIGVLAKKACKSRKEADGILFNVFQEQYDKPGDEKFALGGFFSKGNSTSETSKI